MSATNAFLTYNAKGIREDLIDVIYDISPTDTPFVSNVASGSAKGTFHEWQTDALAAPTNTPIAEGADAAPGVLTASVRLGNYCQIQTRSFGISGTDLVADNAGRGVEMAYQEAKKGLELRRSVEFACVNSNNGYAAGTSGAPTRITGTIMAWIKTNTTKGTAAAADPVTIGATPRTDGTQVTFTEAQLQSVIDKIYISGGDPDVIMCNTGPKRLITSTFRGSTSQVNQDVSAKRIVNAVDFYESDYGTMSVVPNRWMRQREVFVLDTDMWEVAYHRPYMTYDLGKTGDNETKQMVVEWTLVARNEAASGGCFDLT